MMTIPTERLILRPILESDAEDIFAYAAQPNVGPNAGWKPHESIDETREIMRLLFLNQDDMFGMEERQTHKIIGTIGLITDPKRQNPNAMMLGYAMSEAYWGKGLMTEASQAVIQYGFQQKGLHLISCYCYPFNLRSRKVIEKCGFRYEGMLTQCELRYDGVLLDNECFALVRP